MVTGLAIFGLAFVAAQADLGDFSFSTEEPPESIQLYERNFGTLGDAQEDARTTDLGNFRVGEGRGDVLVERRERVELSSRFLGSETASFSYDATQPRDGRLEFEVLSRTGQGQLWVEVNGERVFENHLVREAQETVEIPRSALRHGDNTVRIGTTKGGVFSSASYTLEDVKLYVNDRQFHDHVDTFRMFGYELSDFVSGELTFEVAEAVRPEPLRVLINDREVYSLDRVRGREEVEINPTNADLGVGINEIRFTTEGEAEYTIEDADLTFRYVGRTDQAQAVDSFTLSDEQLEYIHRNDTSTRARYNYQTLVGSPRDMTIELNGEPTTRIPSNGGNSVRLDSRSFSSENELRISGEGSFQLNNFRLVSERSGS